MGMNTPEKLNTVGKWTKEVENSKLQQKVSNIWAKQKEVVDKSFALYVLLASENFNSEVNDTPDAPPMDIKPAVENYDDPDMLGHSHGHGHGHSHKHGEEDDIKEDEEDSGDGTSEDNKEEIESEGSSIRYKL